MSTILSDFNPTNRPVKKIAGDQSRIYADLDLSFNLHPVYQDVRPITDLEAVRKSIKNLVLTNFGERPFHPEIGGNISRLLFEPANRFILKEVQDEIKLVISRFEPRVNAVQVSVLQSVDLHGLDVSVKFNVVGTDQVGEMEFYLERLR